MTQRKLTQDEFRRAMWLAIAPPLILMGAQAALLGLLLLHCVRASERVRQSEEAISTIHQVGGLLSNMESGVRGYFLTSDDESFQRFDQARVELPDILRRLRSLVADSSEQTARIDFVQDMTSRWIDRSLFATTRPTLLDASRLTALIRARDQAMESGHASLAAMIQFETDQKTAHLAAERRAITMGLILGIGTTVGLALAIAAINRRTILGLSTAYQHVLDEEAASNRQFADLAETIPQLIWITDGDGKPVYFNRPCADFSQRSSDDLMKAGWDNLVHPDDQTSAARRWNESLQAQQPFEGEFRLKKGNDGYRWFLCRALPVRSASGATTRWFGTCTDIDSQKQFEHQREELLSAERRAHSDLLRTARAKDEFLANLSHELRTPMTAILGWTRLLREPAIRQRNFERAIEVIDANARVQARLIDDLLDMNRIMSGKLLLKPEVCDFANVVRAAIDTVMPAATGKDIELAVNLDAPGRNTIHGDPGRLQQVVWNLLNNAVKFTPAGGRVNVSLSVAGNESRLDVVDSGRGIAPEFLPFVFERFRQADGAITRQHGGLGLGLAIVRGLVEMHGGSVSVTSKGEGHGATFTVMLPLARSARPASIPAAEPPRTSSDPEILRGQRILVVDDEPDTETIVRMILEQAGAVVTTLNLAAEAIAHCRQGGLDLLISDIGMPDIDGYALIREVRKFNDDGLHRLPAIALTAFARPEDRAAALLAGYDLHVIKPIEPDDLIAAAQAVLQINK